MLYRAKKDGSSIHISEDQVEVYRSAGYQVSRLTDRPKKGGRGDDKRTADGGKDEAAAQAGAE